MRCDHDSLMDTHQIPVKGLQMNNAHDTTWNRIIVPDVCQCVELSGRHVRVSGVHRQLRAHVIIIIIIINFKGC